MTKQINELKKHISRDKDLASSILDQIDKQIRNRMSRDNAAAVPAEVISYRFEIAGGLTQLKNELFFAKAETRREKRSGASENLTYLICKARVGGAVGGDDVFVVSWTSPITVDLLDKPVGHRFEFQPPRRPARTFEILAAARYGTVIPDITDTTYMLDSGEFYVLHENQLGEVLDLAEEALLQEEYKAPEQTALTEIIELADKTQRTAMHLPFKERVLIEGPPGSGKTSIGIMRIPCLIDRQWGELELDPGKHRAFHKESTMRILVMNEEMVPYLQELTRSIGIQHVRVGTMTDYLRRIVRDAGTLTGRMLRDESDALARIKSRRQLLPVYWRAFREHALSVWDRDREGIREHLEKVGGDLGVDLMKTLDRWFSALRSAEAPPERRATNVNLAVFVESWRDRAHRQLPDEVLTVADRKRRTEMRERLRKLEGQLKGFARRVVDRTGIIENLLTGGRRDELLQMTSDVGMGQREVEEALDEWADQLSGKTAYHSDKDIALCAWLGTKITLMQAGESPLTIGGRTEAMTHLVIDEAQDVTPVLAHTLDTLVDQGGTITLVGDLRQRVVSVSVLDSWDELGLPDLRRAAFTINFRQSTELGSFLHALHHQLYQEEPVWQPTTDNLGPRPRVRTFDDPAAIVSLLAREVEQWRQVIPGATVGILHYNVESYDLQGLASDLENYLEETLTPVYNVEDEQGSFHLQRTDCALIASVAATKGLEFDAVVLVDFASLWSQQEEDISDIDRNALYVSASRARRGLSLILPRSGRIPEWPLVRDLLDVVDD
ncbi:MAG: AAA family ATPase [Planctomycetota bacterium]|nr:AAA family ATPase [Planctomycetota bacterium]